MIGLGMGCGTVAGLHYYGSPASGNLAFTAKKIRAHPAYRRVAEQLA